MTHETQLPSHIIDGIKALFDGGVAIARAEDVFTIRQSRPRGHVTAVLDTLRRIELVRVLCQQPGRMLDLDVAAIVVYIVDPASRLAGWQSGAGRRRRC